MTRGPQKGSGGRPAIPNEVKKKRGTARADRLPKAELVAVAPVSGGLDEITVEQALERSLAAGKAWLAESDALGVVLLREALEHLAELKADPKTKPADFQKALTLVNTFAGQCGFTPATRTAMGLAEVKAASKMEALRAQRAKVADTGS